jgi:hypothetical protein
MRQLDASLEDRILPVSAKLRPREGRRQGTVVMESAVDRTMPTCSRQYRGNFG